MVNVMELLLVGAVVSMIFSVAVFVIIKNTGFKGFSGKKRRIVSLLLFVSALLVLCDLFCGTGVRMRLPLDITLSLLPMMVINSSIWEEERAHQVVWYMAVPLFLMILYYILQIIGVQDPISPVSYSRLCGATAVFLCISFLIALYFRLREVKHVMNLGNVWFSVGVLVEFSYLILILIYCGVFIFCADFATICRNRCSSVLSLLLAGELCALGLRAGMDSLFLVFPGHERRIVESMKVAREDSSSEGSQGENTYREIYERVVTVFETQKPYLNSDLTVNDIVKVVFTNKLYISKAIHQYTGRNFCQFVNYYRVNHSIEIFRENPDLRVLELANLSGFNSAVSYGMAFRLFMEESPSDWCRKERNKIMSGKK